MRLPIKPVGRSSKIEPKEFGHEIHNNKYLVYTDDEHLRVCDIGTEKYKFGTKYTAVKSKHILSIKPGGNELKLLHKQAMEHNYILGEFNHDMIMDKMKIALGKIQVEYKNFINRAKQLEEENKLKELAKEEEDLQQQIIEGQRYLENAKKPLNTILTRIFEVLFPGNGKQAMIIWASAVATVRGQPNAVIIRGNPGEGKTVLMEYILQFIPKRHIVRLNDVTVPALMTDTHEKGEDYLDKKIVYLGDLGDRNGFEQSLQARKVLRILQSDGYWSRKLTERVEVAGQTEKQVIKEILRGHPAQWFTTVREDADMQDIDRAVVTTTDLTHEAKIKYIIQHINKNNVTTRRINKMLSYKYIIHSIFEYLITQQEEVIIPYNTATLEYKFRDSGRIKEITELLARINGVHRERWNGYILANDEDLRTTLIFMEKGSGELNETVMKRLREMFKHYGLEKKFSRSDVQTMFPDTFSRPEIAYKMVLKPAMDAMIVYEDKEVKPYTYEFLVKPEKKYVANIPKKDMKMVEREYCREEVVEVELEDPFF